MILAADIGTSSVKAVLFDRDGAAADQATVDIATHTPRPGAREQDPEAWWAALAETVRRLAPARADAIVLAGSMQNCIAAGVDGAPIGRAILYSDEGVSATSLAASLARLPADFAARVGNEAHAAMPVFRLMSDDERLRRGRDIRYHFGAKDVLVERLTGRFVTDPTNATTSGLLNLAARRWDHDLVAAAGLATAQLPELLPADAVVGPLLAPAAAALGLSAGIPVINGSGDAGAATWGAGGREAGQAHAYLGTTGWVAATVTLAEAAPPRDTYTLAAPVGPAVIAIAPLLQAGSVLDWVHGLVGPVAPEGLAAADRTPPPALFLPYLAGERSPFRDRDVRAAFLGLAAETRPLDLAYAAIEGLGNAIRDNLESLALRPDHLPLIGGVAENGVLRQVLADVLGIPVGAAPNPRLATAFGAFLFAASALGWPAPQPAHAPTVLPRRERRARAERRFKAYRQVQAAARAVAPDLLAQPELTTEEHP